MSLAELLVIAFVFVIVIKPEQWPSLVRQVARAIKFAKKLIEKWQAETGDLLDPKALSEREQQAKAIDEQYKSKSPSDV